MTTTTETIHKTTANILILEKSNDYTSTSHNNNNNNNNDNRIRIRRKTTTTMTHGATTSSATVQHRQVRQHSLNNHNTTTTPMSSYIVLSLVSLLVLLLQNDVIVVVDAVSPIYQLDGMGTDSIEQCLWDIMNQIETTASIPLRLSYRALQSSTSPNSTTIVDDYIESVLPLVVASSIISVNGIANTDTAEATVANLPAFFVTDQPLTTQQYNNQFEYTAGIVGDSNPRNTSYLVQIPVLASGINFFHSLLNAKVSNDPNTIDDITASPIVDLKLTPCIIAKIYTGKITKWDHPDIIGLNDDTEIAYNQDIFIYAIRGPSTATLTITTYLNKACPSEFAAGDVTNEFQFSDKIITYVTTYDEMIENLIDNPGAIAYLPLGAAKANGSGSSTDTIGVDDNYKEVNIPIMGAYQTSEEILAATPDAITNAVQRTDFPTGPEIDYENKLVYVTTDDDNNSGQPLWPMVIVTYVIVPKDLSNILPDPVQRSLLYAFLQSFYKNHYGTLCHNRYSYSPLPPSIQEYGQEGILYLQRYLLNKFNATTHEWKFVNATTASQIDITYPYVLSLQRTDYAAYVRNELSTKVTDLQYILQETLDAMSTMENEIEKLSSSGSATTGSDNSNLDGGAPSSSSNNDGTNNDNNNNDSNDDNFNHEGKFTFDEEMEIYDVFAQQIVIALAFSSVSFTLWMIVIIYYVSRFWYRCCKKRQQADAIIRNRDTLAEVSSAASIPPAGETITSTKNNNINNNISQNTNNADYDEENTITFFKYGNDNNNNNNNASTSVPQRTKVIESTDNNTNTTNGNSLSPPSQASNGASYTINDDNDDDDEDNRSTTTAVL